MPRRQIGMVEIIGLDAHFDEAAHQAREGLDSVVDATQQHALTEHGYAGVDEPAAGGARLQREFTRVIGMQDDIERLSGCAECGDQVFADKRRFDDRDARVNPDDPHMGDRRRGLAKTSRNRRGDRTSGSPPVRITSHISS